MAATDVNLPIVKNANSRLGSAYVPTRGTEAANATLISNNGSAYEAVLYDEINNQSQPNLARHEVRYVEFNRSQFGCGG